MAEIDKESGNNSAAPIESRAKFLFIMHLLMSGTLILLLAMRISNQRASRSCSRLVHVYPLISLDFSEAVEMATAQSASAINPE